MRSAGLMFAGAVAGFMGLLGVVTLDPGQVAAGAAGVYAAVKGLSR